MIWLFWILAIVVWLGAGYVAAGSGFAFFRREYPRADPPKRNDRCLFLIPYGIIGLIVVAGASGMFKHRWLNPFGAGDYLPPPPTGVTPIELYRAIGQPMERAVFDAAKPEPPTMIIPELDELRLGLQETKGSAARARIDQMLDTAHRYSQDTTSTGMLFATAMGSGLSPAFFRQQLMNQQMQTNNWLRSTLR